MENSLSVAVVFSEIVVFLKCDFSLENSSRLLSIEILRELSRKCNNYINSILDWECSMAMIYIGPTISYYHTKPRQYQAFILVVRKFA